MNCTFFSRRSQLKQENTIQFATYNNIQDLRTNNTDLVLTKGGQLIVDDTILFETMSGESSLLVHSPHTRSGQYCVTVVSRVMERQATGDIIMVRCLVGLIMKDIHNYVSIVSDGIDQCRFSLVGQIFGDLVVNVIQINAITRETVHILPPCAV